MILISDKSILLRKMNRIAFIMKVAGFFSFLFFFGWYITVGILQKLFYSIFQWQHGTKSLSSSKEFVSVVSLPGDFGIWGRLRSKDFQSYQGNRESGDRGQR